MYPVPYSTTYCTSGPTSQRRPMTSDTNNTRYLLEIHPKGQSIFSLADSATNLFGPGFFSFGIRESKTRFQTPTAAWTLSYPTPVRLKPGMHHLLSFTHTRKIDHFHQCVSWGLWLRFTSSLFPLFHRRILGKHLHEITPHLTCPVSWTVYHFKCYRQISEWVCCCHVLSKRTHFDIKVIK